jgi:hypothetical protein
MKTERDFDFRMTIIELNKRIYTVPTKWDELSSRQMMRAVAVLYGNQDVNTTLLLLFKILTGMSWLRFFLTKAEDKEEFFYLCFFLVNETGPVKNVIKEYRGLYGPDDDFNNITGDEFVFSEDHYFAFINSEHTDLDALNNLVSILYRKPKPNYDRDINPDGDAREPFNQNVSAYSAKHSIKHLPLNFKLSVFHWYHACRHKMIADNPDVFHGAGGDPAKYGLISIMRTIAESGTYGDFDKVQKMYVKMWMMELNEKIEEGKRIEKSIKK